MMLQTKYQGSLPSGFRQKYLNDLFCFLDKGPSIWDTYSHEGKILNGDTGDIACDSYHKYQEDIQLLKQLKVC